MRKLIQLNLKRLPGEHGVLLSVRVGEVQHYAEDFGEHKIGAFQGT